MDLRLFYFDVAISFSTDLKPRDVRMLLKILQIHWVSHGL